MLHRIDIHLFLITMFLLVTCSGMLVFGLRGLTLGRQIIGFVAYFALIAYLFCVIWPTGGITPPASPKPPAPYEIMTCHTTHVYNEPGSGWGDILSRYSCKLVVLEGGAK